jgi:hypothetical protein
MQGMAAVGIRVLVLLTYCWLSVDNRRLAGYYLAKIIENKEASSK